VRCQACTQPLWNAPGRVCAECGTPWKPSDFDLKVNAVQFCCPACGQAYYGTSPKGLLEPPDFTCVTCGAACSMDGNMLMRPTSGADTHEVQWDAMPWPPRPGKLVVDALSMLGHVIGSPFAVGRNLRAQRDTGVLLWIVLLGIPISVGVLGSLMVIWFFERLGTSGFTLRPSEMTYYVTWSAAAIVGPPLALLALSAFCGVVTWCVMRGADERSSFGTAQACWAFSAAPLVLMTVPCIGVIPGIPIGLLGVAALAILVIQTAYVGSTARRLLAALLPPALILLGVIGFAVLAALLEPPAVPPPAPLGATGGPPAFHAPDGTNLAQPSGSESP
jgi:hypothetical protein